MASEAAASAVRVSIGAETGEQETARFLEVWSDIRARAAIRSSAA